jgi:hypothetical protein
MLLSQPHQPVLILQLAELLNITDFEAGIFRSPPIKRGVGNAMLPAELLDPNTRLSVLSVCHFRAIAASCGVHLNTVQLPSQWSGYRGKVTAMSRWGGELRTSPPRAESCLCAALLLILNTPELSAPSVWNGGANASHSIRAWSANIRRHQAWSTGSEILSLSRLWAHSVPTRG